MDIDKYTEIVGKIQETDLEKNFTPVLVSLDRARSYVCMCERMKGKLSKE